MIKFLLKFKDHQERQEGNVEGVRYEAQNMAQAVQKFFIDYVSREVTFEVVTETDPQSPYDFFIQIELVELPHTVPLIRGMLPGILSDCAFTDQTLGYCIKVEGAEVDSATLAGSWC